MPLPSTVLQGFGLILLTKLFYDLTTFLWLHLRPSSLQRYRSERNDSWALVTGASDGIGLGFADALCSEGFHVLLHGRNPEKLSRVESGLRTKHPGAQLRAVVADALDPAADVASVARAAEALPGRLRLLVNNVGGAPLAPLFGALADVGAAHVDGLVNLNARFPAQLTRALLPLLTADSPSLILNVCSVTGLRGLPYLAVYSASKAFNYTFSEALGTELRAQGHDVEVLGIVVGNVISAGNRNDYRGFTCSSLEMAHSALAKVGCGYANVFGWWRHAVQWKMVSAAPAAVVERFIIDLMTERKARDEKAS